MKSTNIKMPDDTRAYLKRKYGTLQNAFLRMVEQDKEIELKSAEFSKLLNGKKKREQK